jgi:hypothetical protein
VGRTGRHPGPDCSHHYEARSPFVATNAQKKYSTAKPGVDAADQGNPFQPNPTDASRTLLGRFLTLGAEKIEGARAIFYCVPAIVFRVFLCVFEIFFLHGLM